jgi:hypothetical protein
VAKVARMRNLLMVLGGSLGACAVAALFGVASVSASEPLTIDPAMTSPDHEVEVMPHLACALPQAVRSVRLREYLYSMADEMSDAYADRKEDPRGRITRLEHFANGIADALEADWRIPTLGDNDWKYGATLVCIAHRETRISRDPRKLGNQDNGRAHGPWQIWSWHRQDPFSATTALDMLLTEPTSSWSLPKKQPWIGYPDCAKYIAAHPFDGGLPAQVQRWIDEGPFE